MRVGFRIISSSNEREVDEEVTPARVAVTGEVVRETEPVIAKPRRFWMPEPCVYWSNEFELK